MARPLQVGPGDYRCFNLKMRRTRPMKIVGVIIGNSMKLAAGSELERVVFAGPYGLMPGMEDAPAVVRPEAVAGWSPVDLAVEIEAPWRAGDARAGLPPPGLRHEPGHSVLGCPGPR